MVFKSIKFGVASAEFFFFWAAEALALAEAAAAAAVECVLLVADDERDSEGRLADIVRDSDDDKLESVDAFVNELPLLGDAPAGPLMDDLRRLEMRIGRLEDDDDDDDGREPSILAVELLLRIECITRASIMCAIVASV